MKTKIEWADAVWNPVTGCTKISDGCANCYAERMSKRLAGRYGYPADDPFKVTLHSDRLNEPLLRKKSMVYFVCSMGDLFHEDVPDEYIGNVANVIYFTSNNHRDDLCSHTFLVLTKRPSRIIKSRFFNPHMSQKIKRNVWLGVSVEDQKTADERIPELLKIPTQKCFLSVEPLLGLVDLSKWLDSNMIGGVIVGGESGPKARPMHPDWVRSIRDQCADAGVLFFFKQWGEWKPTWSAGDHLVYKKDGRVVKDNHNNPDCWKLGLCEPTIRVGKKAAGRILNGREHNDLPWRVLRMRRLRG